MARTPSRPSALVQFAYRVQGADCQLWMPCNSSAHAGLYSDRVPGLRPWAIVQRAEWANSPSMV